VPLYSHYWPLPVTRELGSAKNDWFLILGCGSIGQRHIANLRSLGVRQIGVYDRDQEKVLKAVNDYGVKPFSSLDDAYRAKTTVVVVCAPTHDHLPLALQAANEKCHLFIEKPLADTLSGTDLLVGQVRENKLVTLVGCNMRFHPALRKIKNLLTQNVVGRVVSVRIEVGQYLPDWHPSDDYKKSYSAHRAQGGGVILDAIHELDYARWFFGEISAVSCFSGKLSSLSIDTEDTAGILLRFTSGAIGEVHLDYVQRSYSRTLQVIGEEGTLRWEWGGDVQLFTATSRRWSTFPIPVSWDVNTMYRDEMHHFLRCLDHDEKPEQDVAAAVEVLEVALAAKESSVGEKVVTLHP
jgi:predicted dehydrogenase